MNRWFSVVSILLLAASIAFAFSMRSPKDPVPPLAAEGNRIVRAATLEPIVLKGAVSDYFRYTLKREVDRRDLALELKLIGALHARGANLIGLYLSDFPKIEAHADELDTYIDAAAAAGMYVYLMPVARDFSESYFPVSFSPQPTDDDDLTRLIGFLAERYQDRHHVIYGFGAEPDLPPAEFDRWFRKQEALGGIVRGFDPDALLMATGVNQYDLSGFVGRPLPFENVIYTTGGYATYDDADYAALIEEPGLLAGRYVGFVEAQGLRYSYPILLSEFGGNVAKDFSTPSDLASITEILELIEGTPIGYTAYRMSPYAEGDPLALFDFSGNLTARGEAFASSF